MKDDNTIKLSLSITDLHSGERESGMSNYTQYYNKKHVNNNRSFFIGNGLFDNQIADELNLINKTNPGPNKAVIKKAAENLNLKPEGYKKGTISTYNNGGFNFHYYNTPLRSKEQEILIKNEIEEKSVLKDAKKGVWDYFGVQFRERPNPVEE